MSTGTNLPHGWVEVPLGDVAQVIRGVTFPGSVKQMSPSEGTVACLRTANIQHQIEWHNLIFIPSQFAKKQEQFVRSGDIIMSMANSRELVGKVAKVNEGHIQAAFGGFLAAIRSSLVLPDYLMLVLQDPDAKTRLIDSSTQTTNIANISMGRLKPFRVRMPGRQEQARIVSKAKLLMDLCDQLDTLSGRKLQTQARLGCSLTQIR